MLNSPREDVVEKSIDELEYQAEVAEWVGADVINIHGGGAYGDKAAALARFARNLDRLSDAVRSRLTIENDDKVYTPIDLLPLCRATGLPLVYDVHHHRCLPDGLTIEQATDAALCTWRREPLFHISSPLEGWNGPKPQRHHDYVDLGDFPDCWRQRRITVEVEAKAKELAVLRLRDELLSPVAASSSPSLPNRSQQMNLQAKQAPPEKQDSMRIVGSPSGRGYRLEVLAVPAVSAGPGVRVLFRCIESAIPDPGMVALFRGHAAAHSHRGWNAH